MRLRARSLPAALVLMLCLGSSALAIRIVKIEPLTPRTGPVRLREALDRGDLAAASAIIEEHLVKHSDDGVMLYNAACLHARMGELDHGAARLLEAIKAGFADFSRMRRDRDLRPLRDHRLYQTIMKARDAADPLLGERQVQQWRESHPSAAYRYASDPKRRINIVAAMDEPALEELRGLIEAQFDHLQQALFPDALPIYALVVVPAGEDADALLPHAHAAGHYHHGLRMLVARDADRALRHELVHLLHHRHMDALGQQHPIWIQEGLATLYEGCQVMPDGQEVFAATDRDAAAAYLAARDDLRPWREILEMSDDTFNADAARLYPQVHSIFRFIVERVGVANWYAAYVRNHDADASGATALEETFDQPLDEIEAQWRRWLAEQPMVIKG